MNCSTERIMCRCKLVKCLSHAGWHTFISIDDVRREDNLHSLHRLALLKDLFLFSPNLLKFKVDARLTFSSSSSLFFFFFFFFFFSFSPLLSSPLHFNNSTKDRQTNRKKERKTRRVQAIQVLYIWTDILEEKKTTSKRWRRYNISIDDKWPVEIISFEPIPMISSPN